MAIATLKTLLADTRIEIADLLSTQIAEGEMMTPDRKAAAETEAMAADLTPKTLVGMIAEVVTKADTILNTMPLAEGIHHPQTEKICPLGLTGTTDPASETIAREAAVVRKVVMSLETPSAEGAETEATSRDANTHPEIEKTTGEAIAVVIEATLEVASEAVTVATIEAATEAISVVALEATEVVTELASEAVTEVAIAAIEVASEEALEAAEVAATLKMTSLLRQADSTQAKSSKPLAWPNNSLHPNTVLAMAKVLRTMVDTSKCNNNTLAINSSNPGISKSQLPMIKLQLLQQPRILLLSI